MRIPIYVLAPVLVVALAILAVTVDSVTSRQGAEPPSAADVVPRSSPAIDWRVSTHEDVVRLPDGRVALCEDQAISIADCRFAPYLDRAWPIERVLQEYPFFDPEEAAHRLWIVAHRRFMFEETGDPDWWTPSRIPDMLAERDEAAADLAEMWGQDWLQSHEQPGFRDLLAWRQQLFEEIQDAVEAGDLDRVPSCSRQRETIEHLALRDAAPYVSTERTLDRVIDEFDGLDLADTMLILEVVRSDAESRRVWLKDPSTSLWTEEYLEERLASWSAERFYARRRMGAQPGFEFLAGPSLMTRGNPQGGPAVKECLARCSETDLDSDADVDAYFACQRECGS